ncbi:hypothetical protein [Bacillus sp. JCM 19034]|uniref:hypothetical protein n=1 Tax=Bacillus sp. JCM 19034 TaxID=1481928 RepID=UPI00078374EB|nr:hypothetical protein [Bacillus sp. JCM 19034]
MTFPEVWELSSIFKGGSDSNEFKEFIDETDRFLEQFEKQLQVDDISLFQLEALINDGQYVMQRVRRRVRLSVA